MLNGSSPTPGAVSRLFASGPLPIHLLVMGLVFLAVIVGGGPALQAQAGGAEPEGVSEAIDYAALDQWLDSRLLDDPANPTGSYLSSAAGPYTARPGRLQTYRAQAGDTVESVAAR